MPVLDGGGIGLHDGRRNVSVQHVEKPGREAGEQLVTIPALGFIELLEASSRSDFGHGPDLNLAPPAFLDSRTLLQGALPVTPLKPAREKRLNDSLRLNHVPEPAVRNLDGQLAQMPLNAFPILDDEIPQVTVGIPDDVAPVVPHVEKSMKAAELLSVGLSKFLKQIAVRFGNGARLDGAADGPHVDRLVAPEG